MKRETYPFAPLVSPIILWSKYAVVRWTLGGFTVFAVSSLLLGGVPMALFEAVAEPVFTRETFGLAHSLMSRTGVLEVIPGLSSAPPPLWPPVALWLAIGVAANVAAAAFRPDDLRRRLRR